MDERLESILDGMREDYGNPVMLSSARRCEEHNAREGGATNSAHLTGEAGDLKIFGNEHRFIMVELALSLGIKRLGTSDHFLHIDVSKTLPTPRFWTY